MFAVFTVGAAMLCLCLVAEVVNAVERFLR